jgi:GNAT superfamily N-acetyltransferase
VQGNGVATFLAFDGHNSAGITTGIVDDGGQSLLVSMWVDPALRGRRLGEPLVNAVALATFVDAGVDDQRLL